MGVLGMHTNPEHPALCDHTLSRGLALVPMSDDLQHSERSQRSQNPAEMAWVASGFPALWLQSSVLAGTYASSIVSPLPGTHSIGREHPQRARRVHSPSRRLPVVVMLKKGPRVQTFVASETLLSVRTKPSSRLTHATPTLYHLSSTACHKPERLQTPPPRPLRARSPEKLSESR